MEVRRRKRNSDEQEDQEHKEEEGEGRHRCVVHSTGHNGPTIRVVRLSGVFWLCIGLAIGSICGGPWLTDLVDIIRGYRWNYIDRCIMETPDTDGYGVDFCRIPVDCSICSEVKHIDEIHVDNLPVWLFEEKYAYSSRPLVVRGAAASWEAMEVLDYYWLKDMYLRSPDTLDKTGDDCWFNKYKTPDFRNLRSVFKMPEERIRMESGNPWYVGWSVCHEDVAEKIAELYERPTFLDPESTPSKKPWIFIGTPGPGAHFHVDNVDLASWQAQLKGVKTWYLKPPPECRSSCHGTMQSTLYPGDVLIVNTNIWFHSTKVHGPELSVSMVNEFD